MLFAGRWNAVLLQTLTWPICCQWRWTKKWCRRRGGSFLLMGDDSSDGAECSQTWNAQPAVRETSHEARSDPPSVQHEEPRKEKKKLTSASLLTYWGIKVQGVEPLECSMTFLVHFKRGNKTFYGLLAIKRTWATRRKKALWKNSFTFCE